MNSMIRVTLFLSLLVTMGCRKSPPPSKPPIPYGDTLLNWTRHDVHISTIWDVWFLTPSKGYCVSDGFFKTTDSGKTWTRINSDGFYHDIFFVDGAVGFAKGMTRTEPIFLYTAYTLDGGNSWTEKRLSNSGAFGDIYFVSRSTGYIIGHDGLYKTVDTAKSVQKIISNFTNGMYFFNTNSGFVYTNAFQKTNDGGNTWQPGLSLNLPKNPRNAYKIQFTDNSHGWMSAENAFYKSSDGGITWTKKEFEDEITDIHFINNNVGYLALPFEIFKTTDGGNTWTRSCKMTFDTFLELFFLDENTGWACSSGGYVYRLKM